MIRDLFNIVSEDVRSTIGSNLRTIFIETDVPIIPGVTSGAALHDFKVYQVKGDWQIPLLTLLLQIRDDNWKVIFGDTEVYDGKNDNEVIDMINDICVD